MTNRMDTPKTLRSWPKAEAIQTFGSYWQLDFSCKRTELDSVREHLGKPYGGFADGSLHFRTVDEAIEAAVVRTRNALGGVVAGHERILSNPLSRLQMGVARLLPTRNSRKLLELASKLRTELSAAKQSLKKQREWRVATNELPEQLSIPVLLPMGTVIYEVTYHWVFSQPVMLRRYAVSHLELYSPSFENGPFDYTISYTAEEVRAPGDQSDKKPKTLRFKYQFSDIQRGQRVCTNVADSQLFLFPDEAQQALRAVAAQLEGRAQGALKLAAGLEG